MSERYYLAFRKNKTKPSGIVVRSCGPKGGNVSIRWFSDVGEQITRKELDKYYFFMVTYFPTPVSMCPMIVGSEILEDDGK